MRYLVNRDTKEHRLYDEQYLQEHKPKLRIVEADAEGWIKLGGTECPLPEKAAVSVKFASGSISARHPAGYWNWNHKGSTGVIIAYRPILDKPEIVMTPEVDDLLNRLDAAHEAAAQIPDILAEIRERVGKHGYDLVARSLFVEHDWAMQSSGVYESTYKCKSCEKTAVDSTDGADGRNTAGPCEPLQDMSDWRKWKRGDLVTWEPGAVTYPWWTPGKPYEVTLRNGKLVVIADDGDFYNISGKRLSSGARFRFHSRPEAKS